MEAKTAPHPQGCLFGGRGSSFSDSEVVCVILVSRFVRWLLTFLNPAGRIAKAIRTVVRAAANKAEMKVAVEID